MKNLKQLLLEQEDIKQYTTLNDAAAIQNLDGLEQGQTKIWYVKSEHTRDYMFGLDFITSKLGKEVPSSKNIEETYMLLGSIKERELNSIYQLLQGEVWSPNGEARNLITTLDLSHTSMSIGDIVEIDGNLYFVDRYGFKKLTNGNVVETLQRQMIESAKYNIGDIINIKSNGSYIGYEGRAEILDPEYDHAGAVLVRPLDGEDTDFIGELSVMPEEIVDDYDETNKYFNENKGGESNMATKLNERQLRERILKIYKEEKRKLKEEAGDIISDKNDEPDDIEPKKDVMAGGDNIEKPMDWVKTLNLPKAEGTKLVSAIKKIVKEELSKSKKSKKVVKKAK